MITSIQYGSYILSGTNNVNVNVIREKSPAEAAIGLLQPARARGLDIVSLTEKAKIIEIEGTISNSTNSQTYTDAIRDFVASFQIQANLQLGSSDGLFVYENCIVLNRDNVLRNEAHWNIDFIRFTLQILAPDGVAIATGLTNNSFDNISSSPYTNEISIGGSANPQPVITLTLDSVGDGVSSMTFLNRTTNESISVATAYNSDDIVQIDTKNKQVLYNTRPKRFTGLLPQFQLGTNRFKIDVESSGSLHQSQTSSNGARNVQGNTILSQRINPDSAINVSQIELLLGKTVTLEPELSGYDNFNDNSFDTSLWTNTGQQNATEQNQRLELTTNAPGSVTVISDETDFSGVKFRLGALVDGGGSQGPGSHYAQLAGGALTIRIYLHITANNSIIRIGTSDVLTISGHTHNWEFKPVDDDIEIYSDGVLKHTVEDVNFGKAGQITFHNAPPNELTTIFLDSVEKYKLVATELTDLTVEIQTDNAGDPSGTPVTNGTTTILAADIGESFTIIPAIFAAASLSNGVDYHIVIKQTGGDINNYYSAKINTAGGYAQGEVSVSTDGGTNWTDQTEDLWFKLYGAFASNFNLDADIDHFVTHYSLA